MPENHIIKNFEQLATSPLRRQALKIAEAGFKAINTTKAVQKNFIYDQEKDRLAVLGQEFKLDGYKRIILVGFGKAALEAATAINQILGDKISKGLVIDLKQGYLKNIESRVGTHPLPSKANVEAAKEMVALLEECGKDDLVICLVSGGGSALLCLPFEMTVEEEGALFIALSKKGASISELNTIRKHISRVKGGKLAKIIYPAACISLIFSDVPGNLFSVIASGPTVMDTTTNRDAEMILNKYNVLEMANLHSCHLSETPKQEKYFEKVHNILFMSPQNALSAMRELAEDLGWKTRIYSDAFEGEAKALGPAIVEYNKKGECLLAAGESTVKILGLGQGEETRKWPCRP